MIEVIPLPHEARANAIAAMLNRTNTWNPFGAQIQAKTSTTSADQFYAAGRALQAAGQLAAAADAFDRAHVMHQESTHEAVIEVFVYHRDDPIDPSIQAWIDVSCHDCGALPNGAWTTYDNNHAMYRHYAVYPQTEADDSLSEPSSFAS